MAGHGNEQPKPEDLAKEAVTKAGDFHDGSRAAYNAMMDVVTQAQQQFGNDKGKMDAFYKGVGAGLDKQHLTKEMAENFGASQLEGGAKVNFGDFNGQNGRTPLESKFLTSLRDNFGEFQERAGNATIFGGAKREFGEKEFGRVIDSRDKDRFEAEQARMAQEAQARQQAQLRDVTGALFANDGNPKRSLYSVLDGIKSNSGKNDGDISYGDLKAFKNQYADRSARGDFGFTPENMATVNTLMNEWNGPLGHSLRRETSRSGRDGNGPEYSAYISTEAIGDSMGINGKNNGTDLYAAYAPRNGGVANVSGDGDVQTGARPLPSADGVATDQQFDANGNPIAAAGADTAAAAATTTGDAAASGAVRRDLGPDGRPVDAASSAVRDGSGQVVTDSSGQPVRSGTTAGDAAYNDYMGTGSAADAAGAGDGRARAAAAGAGDAAAAASAGAGADRAARPGRVVAAGGERRPDIDNPPALTMPEFKPGDDMAKVQADFAKAALEHFSAGAVYTVKPGQGWDRIARDTMRKSGEEIPENKVVGFSDQIAKMNGMNGRLDSSKILHPGDQVRVRDDAWIKAQVDAAMAAFQQKVTDATKASEAAAAATTQSTDLYSGQRNGEGDVTAAPAAATTDAAAGTPAAAATTDAAAAAAAATPAAAATDAAAGAAAGTAAAATGDAAAAAARAATPAAAASATDAAAGTTTTGAIDANATGATTALTEEQTRAAEAERRRKAAANGGTPAATDTASDSLDVYSNPLN